MPIQDYTVNYKDTQGQIHTGLPNLLWNVSELYVSIDDYYLVLTEKQLIAYYKYITIVDGLYAQMGNHKRIYNYTEYTGTERKHIHQLQTMIHEVSVLFME